LVGIKVEIKLKKILIKKKMKKIIIQTLEIIIAIKMMKDGVILKSK
jgi:hypothetical protein